MCNIEHAYLGKPQIISSVGGLRHIFSGKSGHYLLEPRTEYFVEDSRDFIGGCAELVNKYDVSEAIIGALSDENEIESIDLWSWELVVEKLFDS